MMTKPSWRPLRALAVDYPCLSQLVAWALLVTSGDRVLAVCPQLLRWWICHSFFYSLWNLLERAKEFGMGHLLRPPPGD